MVDKGRSETEEDWPAFALFLNQTETGRVIGWKKDTISHICDISQVNVTCPHLLKSLSEVNATIISKTPYANCPLIGRKPFDTYTKFTFTYVSHRIHFQPLDFFTLCF